MMNPIVILGILGILLAVYAIYVEKKSKNKGYHAICDLDENISCTKAFNSKYGKTFGVSNSIWGIIFYLALIVLGLFGFVNYIFYLAIFSFVGTLYLVYALYFKLKDFCLVCTGIYLVNTLILVFAYLSV